MVHAAEEVKFQSGNTRSTLLELYTSEGCSSCPAAEQWVSKLKYSTALWKKVVPVAFHVDYWDSMGWKDPFASKQFTKRQYAYTNRWRAGVVYTPMFVKNGEEFRVRYQTDGLGDTKIRPAGVLTAELKAPDKFHVSFSPQEAIPRSWILHGALLGFGASVRVLAGENAGRELTHDFIVLDYHEVPLAMEKDAYESDMLFSKKETPNARQYGAAFWVTREEEGDPVQSIGGFLLGEF